jgi:YedE family putative selenium metabolism protein
VRFILGMAAMIGALVFLGCPWRVFLRLAGGDGNAIFGLIGLAVGVGIGTLFFRAGYTLGRASRQTYGAGLIMPLVAVGLLVLLLIFPQVPGDPKSGVLFYSVKGPGSQHAPIILSLVLGVIVGFIAQRSRFCTMGGLRDLILFRHWHLFSGILALLVAAFIANLILGQFNPGFAGQPVAHREFLEFRGHARGWFGLCTGRRMPGQAAIYDRRRGR